VRGRRRVGGGDLPPAVHHRQLGEQTPCEHVFESVVWNQLIDLKRHFQVTWDYAKNIDLLSCAVFLEGVWRCEFSSWLMT
jgi:hypothetical protein